MKKSKITMKKLVLAKETLRSLEAADQLEQVVGGATSGWTQCSMCCPQN